MKRIRFKTLFFILTFVIFSPLVAGAEQVPWNNTAFYGYVSAYAPWGDWVWDQSQNSNSSPLHLYAESFSEYGYATSGADVTFTNIDASLEAHYDHGDADHNMTLHLALLISCFFLAHIQQTSHILSFLILIIVLILMGVTAMWTVVVSTNLCLS